MKRLVGLPVVAPFFFIFGLLFAQFGLTYLTRGSFQFTPQHSPTQIISPATNAPIYWMVTDGLLAVGALFVAIAVCATVCLFRGRGAKNI